MKRSLLPIFFCLLIMTGPISLYLKGDNSVPFAREKTKEILKLRKMIRKAEKGKEFGKLELFYYKLGENYREINDYVNSLKAFYFSKGFSEKTNGKLRCDIYLKIAEIFRILGREGAFKKYLSKAFDVAKKSDSERHLIKIFNLQGEIAFENGEAYKALNYYQESVGLSAKNGLFPEMIETGYKISLQFLRSGDYQTGMKILKDVIDSSISGGYFNNLLPKMFQYVKRLLKSGKTEIAVEYLKKSDEIFAPNYKTYFFYDYLNARLMEESERREEALKFYRRTLYGLDRYFAGMRSQAYYSNKSDIDEIYSGTAKFFFKMFDYTNRVDYLKQAVYISEIKNSYIYKWENSQKDEFRFIRIELKRVESEIKRLNRRISGYSIERKEGSHPGNPGIKELNRLNLQKMDILEFIREASKKLKKFNYKDLDSVRVRSLLDNRSVILKFVVLEDYIYVIVIDKDSISYKKIETPAKEIFSEVRELIKPFKDFSEGKVDLLRVKYDMKLSKKIYDNLLFDILEFNKDKNMLYIIPDGILYQLPFEALVTEFRQSVSESDVYFSQYKKAVFLSEKYSTSYFFSLFHFKRKACNRKKRYKITVFGAPIIDNSLDLNFGRQYGHLGNIPSSMEEIKKIRSIFGEKDGRYYSGTNFTVKNFLEKAPLSGIVHIASHYVQNRKFPGYSSVICSPGEERQPLLYISDISKLKLNCDLIVLSACESAEGGMAGEQSLKGIASSFYKAGAKYLIASLWPVDQFSSRLTPYIFNEIKNKRFKQENLAKILKKIKVKFMNKTVITGNKFKISMRHPIFWANFILYNFYF